MPSQRFLDFSTMIACVWVFWGTLLVDFSTLDCGFWGLLLGKMAKRESWTTDRMIPMPLGVWNVSVVSLLNIAKYSMSYADVVVFDEVSIEKPLNWADQIGHHERKGQVLSALETNDIFLKMKKNHEWSMWCLKDLPIQRVEQPCSGCSVPHTWVPDVSQPWTVSRWQSVECTRASLQWWWLESRFGGKEHPTWKHRITYILCQAKIYPFGFLGVAVVEEEIDDLQSQSNSVDEQDCLIILQKSVSQPKHASKVK